MRVLKFGGSSLATVQRFIEVANIIKNKSQSSRLAVVVSAPQGVTNHLVAMAENISDEDKLKSDLLHFKHAIDNIIEDLSARLPKFCPQHSEQVLAHWEQQLSRYLHGATLLSFCPEHVRARIISIGERLSVALLQSVLAADEYQVSVIESERLLRTNDVAMNAVADLVLCTDTFQPVDSDLNAIALMPGFIGLDSLGNITTL